MIKKNRAAQPSFEVTLDGVKYTRRPNGLWTPTDRPWEKVVGPDAFRLEGIYAEAKEKCKEKAQAEAAKVQALKEAFKIARMDDDEWFEKVYG